MAAATAGEDEAPATTEQAKEDTAEANLENSLVGAGGDGGGQLADQGLVDPDTVIEETAAEEEEGEGSA